MTQVFADEDRGLGGRADGNAALRADACAYAEGTSGREDDHRPWNCARCRDQSPAPILIDVLDGRRAPDDPRRHWLREPGKAVFGQAEADGFRQDLEKLTKGRKSAPIVFFCLSSECWLSYNAGLRAIELGYTNVYWFRGGTAAWQRAGFETRESEPFRR